MARERGARTRPAPLRHAGASSGSHCASVPLTVGHWMGASATTGIHSVREASRRSWSPRADGPTGAEQTQIYCILSQCIWRVPASRASPFL